MDQIKVKALITKTIVQETTVKKVIGGILIIWKCKSLDHPLNPTECRGIKVQDSSKQTMETRAHIVSQEEATLLKIEASLDMIQEMCQWTILKVTKVAREFILLALDKHYQWDKALIKT